MSEPLTEHRRHAMQSLPKLEAAARNLAEECVEYVTVGTSSGLSVSDMEDFAVYILRSAMGRLAELEIRSQPGVPTFRADREKIENRIPALMQTIEFLHGGGK